MTREFQCSSASRKFLNSETSNLETGRMFVVSVLFSEPKIPQYDPVAGVFAFLARFSALQRAENSSIAISAGVYHERSRFSALQRAENSSITPSINKEEDAVVSFSALQRAENSSMYHALNDAAYRVEVSVLFSEPKIPQFGGKHLIAPEINRVSVLFSEPKIPQFRCYNITFGQTTGFSALQRAENSSIRQHRRRGKRVARFSALQRAENSSMRKEMPRQLFPYMFQCSSASRKFLNW